MHDLYIYEYFSHCTDDLQVNHILLNSLVCLGVRFGLTWGIPYGCDVESFCLASFYLIYS